MKKVAILPLSAVLAAGGSFPVTAAADGMFDIMNPGRWFGDNDDDWNRYGRWGGPYGYGPYGYGGPYGHGPYGYGGPWGGYGPYGYGAPYGYPGGYGPGGSTIVVTPQGGGEKSEPRVPE